MSSDLVDVFTLRALAEQITYLRSNNIAGNNESMMRLTEQAYERIVINIGLVEKDSKCVKCPRCTSVFYVAGNIPKSTVCDDCGTQFNVDFNEIGVREDA